MTAPRRRTVRDLRRGNRAVVLSKLYFDGPLSRQELGPLTALSSGSISNVVAELVADGLLEEAGSVDSDGGRPRTLLRVAPGSGHLVGVDVGETRVRVELFDLALGELARVDEPLPAAARDGSWDAKDVVRLITVALTRVLADAEVAPESLLGVGIGVPGIVDASGGGGAVVHGQTIGWDAVPLEAMLRAPDGLPPELPPQLPLFLDNGAKTLGRAEMWFGAGRGARSAVIALIGSGVGACVIADGLPYQGASSSAGEWGHTVLQVGGRDCRCGARGCLEAYVGAEALLARWREAGGSWTSADEEGALAELLEDPSTEGLLDETAEFLGAGIADLVNLFNPERIVVGGWAGLMLGPRLLAPVRRAAASYALHHPFAQTTVELGRLGPDAVTVGAATLPLARFLETGGQPSGD
ncbi:MULTISPECIES: ROK family transcriptional regulator [unclassified Streptomyces]|uniref:ROK family transcriptional regulator n=1 Tax=unclassified Streptomyces TaxID=2593676 RepID=UPI002E193B13|nr:MULTISPECIES: ROK family protein [unclassified Streptomyces]